jgi:hypothetical protein
LGFTLWSVLLKSGRLGIPAELTHMPLAFVAAVRPKADSHGQRLGFWALFPPQVPRGWIRPLSLTAAGGSSGVRPSRGLPPPWLVTTLAATPLTCFAIRPTVATRIAHTLESQSPRGFPGPLTEPGPLLGFRTFPHPDVQVRCDPGYVFTSPASRHC